MNPERLSISPSQTVGPFYHFALTANGALGSLVQPETRGERIRVRFRLLDGGLAPVSDAMIEIWQADASGTYCHPADPGYSNCDPAFRGFGRLPTDEDGIAVFETVYPGGFEAEGATYAPHINVSIFARGLLRHLCTRLYFAGDPRLSSDPVLHLVPEERRQTLLAQRDSSRADQWNFEIRLQGDNETVFFDI